MPTHNKEMLFLFFKVKRIKSQKHVLIWGILWGGKSGLICGCEVEGEFPEVMVTFLKLISSFMKEPVSHLCSRLEKAKLISKEAIAIE